MKDSLKMDRYGMIERAEIGGREIPFRSGEWAGPSWRVRYSGETHAERQNASEDQGTWKLSFWGIQLSRRIEHRGDMLVCRLEAENASSQPFYPENLGIWLGIDTYMAQYPQWNDKLFPTLLRCERTHFYGYFSSPAGDILAVCCPQPIASWKLQYNHMFSDNGHRIEGVTLDLLCAGPLADHHPKRNHLEPGEKRVWEICLKFVSSVREALEWCSKTTGALVLSADRLIFEQGEEARLTFFSPGEISLTCGDKVMRGERIAENEFSVTLPAGKEGEYAVVQVESAQKQAEVRVYWRRKWSWYLCKAAQEALRCPQKASSHVESWYGYFSGLLAMRYLPEDERDQAILSSMNENIPLAYDMETGLPTVIPNRIQNTSGLVSIAVDAWQATGDEKWLRLAEKAADFLINRCQDENGAFRNGSGVHYTCVVYVAKSIQELWLCEREIAGREEKAAFYYAAVRRAVDELVEHLDDIGTEGETTFEDGMISCSVAQIAYFALYLPEAERKPYIRAAEILLKKHRCLERMGSPDCRSRNTTIRFWEAQYDILIPCNMISSPHGWSAWKAYGVWYLYLLTGKKEYLKDVMELLGCCAQLIGTDGKMNWGFAVDPQIRSFIVEPDQSGRIRPVPSVYGECYLPMISSWYLPAKDRAVFGYLGVYNGFDTDQGGCCDNDVHEWVKAMGEIVLPYAYVHEDENGMIGWNTKVYGEKRIQLAVMDDTVRAVYVRLMKEEDVEVQFGIDTVCARLKAGWICADGSVTEEIPE